MLADAFAFLDEAGEHTFGEHQQIGAVGFGLTNDAVRGREVLLPVMLATNCAAATCSVMRWSGDIM